MRIAHGSYILVADGAKMLLLRNAGQPDRPQLAIVAAEQQADPPDRAIKTDGAGRKPSSGAEAGGPSTGEADYHQQAEDRFAGDAADRINRAALAQAFDALIVVAPPKTLGLLRRLYRKEVVARLTAEIAKDLTGHPIDRIEEMLRNHAE